MVALNGYTILGCGEAEHFLAETAQKLGAKVSFEYDGSPSEPKRKIVISDRGAKISVSVPADVLLDENFEHEKGYLSDLLVKGIQKLHRALSERAISICIEKEK